MGSIRAMAGPMDEPIGVISLAECLASRNIHVLQRVLTSSGRQSSLSMRGRPRHDRVTRAREVFHIEEVATEDLALRRAVWADQRAQRMGIGKEVEVQVERISVRSFCWDDDDDLLSSYAPQLRKCCEDVSDMFDRMRGHDGIE